MWHAVQPNKLEEDMFLYSYRQEGKIQVIDHIARDFVVEWLQYVNSNQQVWANLR